MRGQKVVGKKLTEVFIPHFSPQLPGFQTLPLNTNRTAKHHYTQKHCTHVRIWYDGIQVYLYLPGSLSWRLTTCTIDDSKDARDQVYGQGGGYDNPDNKAKFSHELIAGAASFEGFKLYEDHQRKEGKLGCYS
jgi:Protein of unknown function (DUF3759)